ncbi:MAG TPA: maltose alpha-D-glucosyltransferase [Roseiflexaceae bacterium]|nr:maltose alpha-D-glucosyltransferase [Roseiflexaceae bacterium]
MPSNSTLADAIEHPSSTLWYKDAIIYELHVRAFHDSNADGIGDFRGLTAKLDYLQDLGITAIWLLPFYPSPLLDDGYDIADYGDVHAAYGSLSDFKTFLKEAHRRGLRVIIELVLNHTSDQHPWFQRARQAAPGSTWRNFYVWSDTPERYEDARVIFKDFESSNWSWDAAANAYYWHRFYSHQPDLNYDNPHVRKAILKVVDFWLRLGVDGLRLDAVPYLFEREGTTGENLPRTHVALRRLRRHIDEHFEDRMLLAEANQWPEDAVAYFGAGDECHMAFHFPLMPRLFMSVRKEDRFPIVDILDQTPPIPPTAQWALFLRNHDELTLEMVTDEERIYMYRTYARDATARINLGIRRRLAPLLRNNRRQIELLNGLLFSLPGTPVLYYGDEIGMGDNVYLGDRNGVRTPMQWSADRNAGFSQANPQQLYLPLIVDHEYHHETVQVEAQQDNSSSLLSWMKRLIALRKRYHAFGNGDLQLLQPENRKILAFIRCYQEERILVVANLSRFFQHVELDLSAFQGQMPVEMFGRITFPPIGELPYLLTLGPHAFYWFALEPQPANTPARADSSRSMPTITVAGDWENIIRGQARAALEDALPAYLRERAWFGGKRRVILSAALTESVPVPCGRDTIYLASVRVNYADGEPEAYTLPLGCIAANHARSLLEDRQHALIARLAPTDGGDEMLLYDALWAEALPLALLQAIARRRQFSGLLGTLAGAPQPGARKLQSLLKRGLRPNTLHAKHNNTSVIFGDRLILKLFRCIDEGINPDLEIGRFLTSKGFEHTPQLIGALEYRHSRGEPTTIAVLQKFVANQGDAWEHTQQVLKRFFKRAPRTPIDEPSNSLATPELLSLAEQDAPPYVRELIGDYLDLARLLGQRTAELHLALSSEAEDLNMVPQPFTPLYQRSVYQSMRSLVMLAFDDLRKQLPNLPEEAQAEAEAILGQKDMLIQRFRMIADQKIDATRTRIHGDYHLGQVLFTGDDFVIFDFEGPARRPVPERQLKRSPLLDVACMLRSFRYATYSARLEGADQKRGWERAAALEPWACLWTRWVSAAFLNGYFEKAGNASFLPKTRPELLTLLDVLLLEKAVQELDYELNHRQQWIRIPLLGIQQLLGDQ